VEPVAPAPPAPAPAPAPTGPRVDAYRRVGGHHIHQSAAYAPAGTRSRSGNPNHNDAIALEQDVPGFSTQQHAEVTQFQRNLNRAQHGLPVHQPTTGSVTIAVEGAGQTTGTASPWFEDLKAYYGLISGGIDQARAFGLTIMSSEQLSGRGVPVLRVPRR
jgi:hypothetical protein